MTDKNPTDLTDIEEILDTIADCEAFLEDYASHVAAGGSNAGGIFNINAAEFAKNQITFERGELAKLEAAS